MKLSKTSAHAAMAMAYLAQRQDDGIIQARQVADYLGIPTDSALKVLQTLARYRLVQSQLGRSGGYRINRPADRITLLEIVEAIDGPIDAAPNANDVEGDAGQVQKHLQGICVEVAQHIRADLARTSVAALAASQARPVPQMA